MKKIKEIHESFINGQIKQAVNQINEYGVSLFWEDYLFYLSDNLYLPSEQFKFYTNAVNHYHRIMERKKGYE